MTQETCVVKIICDLELCCNIHTEWKFNLSKRLNIIFFIVFCAQPYNLRNIFKLNLFGISACTQFESKSTPWNSQKLFNKKYWSDEVHLFNLINLAEVKKEYIILFMKKEIDNINVS